MITRRILASALALATTFGLAPVAEAAAPTAAAAVPVADDRCFVGVSHDVFLGRAATEAEQSRWRDAFAAGAPRSALPAALAGSDEWLSVVVADIYRGALDREPDATGRDFWVARLRAGSLVNRIGAQVYGSPEAYSRAGGTDPAFVTYLYDRILHRAPVAADRDYWVARVAAHGRGWVAGRFFASAESRGDRVDALYDRILGRTPDATGRAFWVGRLATVNDVRLAVQLASSAEARTRADQTCWTMDTLPVSEAMPFPDVSADGRWVVTTGVDDQHPGGGVLLVDTTTGQTTAITDEPVWGSATISADGSTIAYTAQVGPGQIHPFTHDVATGVTTDLMADADGSADGRPSISADGRVVAFQATTTTLVPDDTDRLGDVFIHDAATDTIHLVSTGPGTTLDNRTPQISPDGEHLMYEWDEPRIRIWLVDLSGADDPIDLLTTPPYVADLVYATFTGDGRLVAAVPRPPTYEHQDVVLFRPGTDELPIVVSDPTTTDRAYNPSSSDDGEMVAWRSGGSGYGIVVADATGRRWDLTAGIDRFVDSPQMSADGRTVVFQTSTTFSSDGGTVTVARFLG